MTNEDEAGDRKDGQPENKDGKDHGVLYIGMDLGTSRTSVSASNSVRETFAKYQLEYEDKDIINNPDIYAEMVQKSGQPLSPCVEINGQMLADVSGEEVEAWMVENGVVESTAA